MSGEKGMNVDNMCLFCMNLVVTTKLCLWNCDFAMEIWNITVILFIPIYL